MGYRPTRQCLDQLHQQGSQHGQGHSYGQCRHLAASMAKRKGKYYIYHLSIPSSVIHHIFTFAKLTILPLSFLLFCIIIGRCFPFWAITKRTQCQPFPASSCGPSQMVMEPFRIGLRAVWTQTVCGLHMLFTVLCIHPVDDLLPTVFEHYHQLDIRCLRCLE